jgi:transposase
MTRKRLTMRKIREVIRLKYESKLSNRVIAGACKISNSTVGEYLRRAETVGISWPLGEIGEEELYQKLYPEKGSEEPEPKYPMPDWEKIKDEKQKRGVTLQLLWVEYNEVYPNGYKYSQFCEHYQRWKKSQIEPSKHNEHTGGEQMQVDYAGQKIPIINPETGEISEVCSAAKNYSSIQPHPILRQRSGFFHGRWTGRIL